MKTELEVAIAAARNAGSILLDRYRRPVEVAWKGPRNPVTIADQEANAFILRALMDAFPEDRFVTEEEPPVEGEHRDRIWFVDPMDGTKEFIKHVDEFSVMIGLAVLGKPVLGVVYHPTVEKLYYAVAGSGAFVRQDSRVTALHVPKETDPAEMVVARSRSRHDAAVDEVCKRLGVTHSIASGSVGLKAGLICEGLAHFYIHAGPETSLWDTCAPEAILTEAGGRMTDCEGMALRYDPRSVGNTRGVLASTGVIHDRLVKAMRKSETILKEPKRPR